MPDHHGFLADIEVAEAADQPHAVKLARLLLEAADQQHVAVGPQQLVPVIAGSLAPRAVRPRLVGAFSLCLGHATSPTRLLGA